MNFVVVSVVLHEREYEKLLSEAARTGEGTIGAALRVRAKMPEKPIGIVKAKREGTANYIQAYH
jgi:hypothetical protein